MKPQWSLPLLTETTPSAILTGAESPPFPYREELPQPQSVPSALMTAVSPYSVETVFTYCSFANSEPAKAGLARLKDDAGQPLLGDFRLRLAPSPLLQAERFEAAWRDIVAPLLEKEGFAGFDVLAGAPVSGYFDRTGEKASS